MKSETQQNTLYRVWGSHIVQLVFKVCAFPLDSSTRAGFSRDRERIILRGGVTCSFVFCNGSKWSCPHPGLLIVFLVVIVYLQYRKMWFLLFTWIDWLFQGYVNVLEWPEVHRHLDVECVRDSEAWTAEPLVTDILGSNTHSEKTFYYILEMQRLT